MSNPNLTRFCVELEEPMAVKLRAHIARHHKNNGRKFVEAVITRISIVQKALDATCAATRKEK